MSCTITEVSSYGCTKCSTTSYTKDGSFCHTFITNICDECIPIDEEIYNIPESILQYRGELCFSNYGEQKCYNYDSHDGPCTKYNPGCNGCCLQVNSKVGVCLRLEEGEFQCTPEEFQTYNESVEGYSGFVLSVTLITFICTLGLLIFYFIKRPIFSENNLKIFDFGGRIYLVACALLLLIQLCLCYTSFLCSGTSRAAIAFIILSAFVVGIFLLETKDGFLSKKLIAVKIGPLNSDSNPNLNIESPSPVVLEPTKPIENRNIPELIYQGSLPVQQSAIYQSIPLAPPEMVYQSYNQNYSPSQLIYQNSNLNQNPNQNQTPINVTYQLPQYSIQDNPGVY